MEGAEPSKNSKLPPPPPLLPPAAGKQRRDPLLHLESYLARRDGVDKLLKISRYAAKIALASGAAPEALIPQLRAFESSVGLSRKAFRLGKFVQDVNALRAAARSQDSASDRLLAAVAYGGEGVYYFVEQLVWLSKAGLISKAHSRQFQRVSSWAELVGYVGSVALKARELRRIQSILELKAISKLMNGNEEVEENLRLREKLLLKQLSIVQDLADGLMALSDVLDVKGFLSAPLMLASAGMLSALISTHKNWSSC